MFVSREFYYLGTPMAHILRHPKLVDYFYCHAGNMFPSFSHFSFHAKMCDAWSFQT
jgi:hypothetical protein